MVCCFRTQGGSTDRPGGILFHMAEHIHWLFVFMFMAAQVDCIDATTVTLGITNVLAI